MEYRKLYTVFKGLFWIFLSFFTMMNWVQTLSLHCTRQRKEGRKSCAVCGTNEPIQSSLQHIKSVWLSVLASDILLRYCIMGILGSSIFNLDRCLKAGCPGFRCIDFDQPKSVSCESANFTDVQLWSAGVKVELNYIKHYISNVVMNTYKIAKTMSSD